MPKLPPAAALTCTLTLLTSCQLNDHDSAPRAPDLGQEERDESADPATVGTARGGANGGAATPDAGAAGDDETLPTGALDADVPMPPIDTGLPMPTTFPGLEAGTATPILPVLPGLEAGTVTPVLPVQPGLEAGTLPPADPGT